MVNKQIQEGTPTENVAAYCLVEKEIREMKYGHLSVTFRIHNSRVTDVVFQAFRRIRLDTLDKGKEVT